VISIQFRDRPRRPDSCQLVLESYISVVGTLTVH